MQVDPIGYEDQVNLYAYVGNDPMNAFDPSGMTEFYFGGGADGYTFDAFANVQKYADNRGNFYTHAQRDQAMNDIRAAASNGEKIIIIGHSWGGWSAATVAGKLIDEGIQPGLLVTIDPVGPLSGQTLSSLENRDGLWANISTSPSLTDMTMGDLVAAYGNTPGPLGNGFTQTGRADVNIPSNAHHEDFGRMMDELDVPEMICGVDPESENCGGGK